MRSSNSLSNTHLSAYTLGKHVDWKKFAGDEKFFLVGLKSICALQHIARLFVTVVASLMSEFQAKRSRFVGLRFARNAYPVWHIGRCLCCWCVWARMKHSTGYFGLMVCCHEWHSVWTSGWFENFCHVLAQQMSVSYAINHSKLPLACVTLMCCRTLTSYHTHLKGVDRKISWETKTWIWAHSKLFVCYKTQYICCARLWKVWGADFKDTAFTFHMFFRDEKMYVPFYAVDAVNAVRNACVGM
jgi:hypothetical protein